MLVKYRLSLLLRLIAYTTTFTTVRAMTQRMLMTHCKNQTTIELD